MKITDFIPPKKLPPNPAENQLKVLHDSKDIGLAIANATLLTTMAFGLYVPFQQGCIKFITEIWQRIKAQEAMPARAQAEKALTHAIFPLLSFFSPTIGKISLIANLIGIARNCAPKLNTCFKTLLKNPSNSLIGIGFHSFNLTAQSYFTHKAFI